MRPAMAYLSSIALVLAVTAAKASMLALGYYPPALLYLLAVVVAALLGGLGPGLTASGAAAVCMNVVFLRRSPDPWRSASVLAQTLALAAEGSIIAVVTAAVRRRHRRAASAMGVQASHGRLLEVVQSITMALSRTRTPEEIARVIIEGASGAFGADKGMLWRMSEDRRGLALVHHDGLTPAQAAMAGFLPCDSPWPVVRALADGITTWVSSVDEYAARYPEAEALSRAVRDSRDVAFLVAPLRVGDKRYGAMAFVFGERRTFSDTETRFVAALAEQTAQAFDRVELLAAERAARERGDRGFREAREANRCKDEFLATLSHELRTPLSAILGWTRILKMRPQMDPQHGLEVIDRNAYAQLRLIEDVLDVSRIAVGKLRLDPKPIDLGAVLRAAGTVVAPAAAAKGVTLAMSTGADPCEYVGDADRLQQVFWNLLSNAVKFTPAGGRVEARLVREGSRVRVVVRDTGRGIRPEFLPHVFDTFRQADGSTTRTAGGLGLGLSIVKHLTELHGGEVSAESAGEGEGATFTVTLPRDCNAAGEAAEASQRARSSAPPRVLTGHSLEGLKLVVCEDDADAREIIADVLSDEGAVVHATATAGEALREVQAFHPDVLVSDIGLPGVDGYALMRELRTRRDDEGGQTPGIALTAYARSQDARAALEAGYYGHLTKPVEPGELVAMVASLSRRTSLAPSRVLDA